MDVLKFGSDSVFLSVSQVNQLDSQSALKTDSVGTLYVMKSRLLKDGVVDSIYKSKDSVGVAAQRKEDAFYEVRFARRIRRPFFTKLRKFCLKNRSAADESTSEAKSRRLQMFRSGEIETSQRSTEAALAACCYLCPPPP